MLPSYYDQLTESEKTRVAMGYFPPFVGDPWPETFQAWRNLVSRHQQDTADLRWISLAVRPEFAYELFMNGMTRKQIAHELGVSYDRVKRWIQRELAWRCR